MSLKLVVKTFIFLRGCFIITVVFPLHSLGVFKFYLWPLLLLWLLFLFCLYWMLLIYYHNSFYKEKCHFVSFITYFFQSKEENKIFLFTSKCCLHSNLIEWGYFKWKTDAILFYCYKLFMFSKTVMPKSHTNHIILGYSMCPVCRH